MVYCHHRPGALTACRERGDNAGGRRSGGKRGRAGERPGSAGRVFSGNAAIILLRPREGVLDYSIHIVYLSSPTEDRTMLTDYMVACPNPRCHWSGSLLPQQNRDAWRSALPATQVILFQCPKCRCEWRAHLIGDELVRHHEELVGAGG